MLMCAIETSGKNCSVALLRDAEVLAYDSLLEPARHSIVLMPLVDRLFRQCSLAPADVDVFAVGVGPGSFTGLRIGIGTIKGLAFPYHTPCAGVSTLASLACSAGTSSRTILPVIDARRGRVYAGAYRWQSYPCAIAEDGVTPICQLWQEYSDHDVLFIGDAASICYTIWEDNGYAHRAECMQCEPDALGTAMAAQRIVEEGLTVSPALLVPRYLLETQAERECAARENTHENIHSQ